MADGHLPTQNKLRQRIRPDKHFVHAATPYEKPTYKPDNPSVQYASIGREIRQ